MQFENKEIPKARWTVTRGADQLETDTGDDERTPERQEVSN